jgi:hypothetical protein
VEISAQPPRSVDDPWRTATFVAGGLAALELVLLLIAGIALVGKPLAAHAKEAGTTHAIGIPSASARPEPKHVTLSRARTTVLVLNGNGVAGAAAGAAAQLRGLGYPEAATGNAPRGYGQSIVMYRPGRRPEGQRLARDLGIELVGPLDGLKLRQLHGAQAVVVLGA